jgi:hypothetical protein
VFTAGGAKLIFKTSGHAAPALISSTKDEVWKLFGKVIDVTENPAFVKRLKKVFGEVDVVLQRVRENIADYLTNPAKQFGFGKGRTAWIDESRFLMGEGLKNTASAIRHELSHAVDMLLNPAAFGQGLERTTLLNLLKTEYRAFYAMGRPGWYSMIIALGTTAFNKLGVEATLLFGREAAWAAGNYAVPYLINELYE